MGIPITLNSDAHKPDEVTACFSDAEKMLMEIGFDEIAVLENGRWTAKRIR